MSSWLFVLGDEEALQAVLRRQLMAFRDHIGTGALDKGDKFAIYVTRGALHNPTRDRAQLIAAGTVESGVSRKPVKIANEEFNQSVKLSFSIGPFPLRQGIEFAPLVDDLDFIRKKKSWFAYVRKSLVRIPDEDFGLIERRLASHNPE